MVRALLLAAALPLLPNPTLTPGVIASTDRAEVCVPGYATAHRHVTTDTKLDVYRAYHLEPAGRWVIGPPRRWQSDFEVDHLVPLALGGSNDPRNLWPQSYRTRTWNATAKDALENRIRWMVCVGRTLTLADAQQAIRANWIVAYRFFITNGPPPPRARED